MVLSYKCLKNNVYRNLQRFPHTTSRFDFDTLFSMHKSPRNRCPTRSLQLTERSPNRPISQQLQQQHHHQQQQHKLTVRLNANQSPASVPPNQPSPLPANHTDRRASHQSQQSRSPSMQLPGTKSRSPNARLRNANAHHQQQPAHHHNRTSARTDFRHSAAAAIEATLPDKSHSFDGYSVHHAAQQPPHQHQSFKSDFDKSRSFDDDYGNAHRPGITVTESRSFSNDRMYTGGAHPSSTATPPTSKQTSPLGYGSRLYEHEMMYDLARKAMDRSPIMEFRRQQRKVNGGRERSPNGTAPDAVAATFRTFNRSFEQSLNQPAHHRERELSPSSGGETYTTTGHQSASSTTNSFRSATNNQSSASPASDYEHAGGQPTDDLQRETEMVAEFLYGQKQQQSSASAFHAPVPVRRKGSSAATAAAGVPTGTPSPGRYFRN